MQTKSKVSCSDAIPSDKVILEPSRSLCDYGNNSKTAIPSTLKGIGDSKPRPAAPSARTSVVLPNYPFGHNEKGDQVNGYTILLLLKWNSY